MSDRDRDIPAAEEADASASDAQDRAGRAPGTGSLGSPPTDAPDGDSEDVSAGGITESDLGGVDIGGAGKPGAGLGATRGGGFGTGA